MNPLRRYLINRRLKAMMKPQPDYLKRRLAQFNGARRERFMRNVGGVL
jgi:hypothetical protein